MAKDWTPVQGEIKQLYHVQNKPLAEVMRIVKGKYGFIASERSYRTQLQKWGFTKYNTQAFPKPITKSDKRRARAAISHLDYSQQNLPGVTGFPITLPTFSSIETGTSSLYYNAAGQPAMDFANADLNNPELGNLSSQSSSFNLNATDGSGRTQLHHAVSNQDVELVRTLLSAGAAVDTKDTVEGQSPIHLAAISGNIDILKLLINFGADVNAKQIHDYSPIYLAIHHMEVAKVLLENGANPSVQDDRGNTPLHEAITSNEGKGLVEALIRKGSDPNEANHAGFTPFLKHLEQNTSQSLSKYSFLSLTNFFLDNGASVTTPTPAGRAPLELFLQWSGTECFKSKEWGRRSKDPPNTQENETMRKFLEKGACVMTPMASGKPLIVGYFESYVNTWCIDRSLATRLCQLTYSGQLGQHGDLILHTLAKDALSRNPAVVCMEVLLKHGADANYPHPTNGNTPLTTLAGQKRNYRGIQKPMKTLLAHGADPWQLNDDESCAIFAALDSHKADIPKRLLLMLEADLQRQEWSNSSAIRSSAIRNCVRWEGWKRAISASSWRESKHHVLSEENRASHDIGKIIRESAMAALARKHIKRANEMFQGDADAIAKRRSYVATILRDCRNHEGHIDVEDFDYLLELCG